MKQELVKIDLSTLTSDSTNDVASMVQELEGSDRRWPTRFSSAGPKFAPPRWPTRFITFQKKAASRV